MYKVNETVLPIYINGQCPIIKTCSDVTLNLSSKDGVEMLRKFVPPFIIEFQIIGSNIAEKMHFL